MSNATPPAIPPALPPDQPPAPAVQPIAEPVVPPAPAAPAPTGGATPRGGFLASMVSVALALLLIDMAVETFLAGSPLLVSIVVVEALTVVLLALLWSRVGPTTRVMIPLVGLAGLVAWAVFRAGAGADPALRLATLALPRIVVAMTAAGVVMAAVAPLLLFPRRWSLGVPLALVGLYALVPLGRALVNAAALPRVLAGEFDWQRLPFWLQGGYLGGGALVPLGLVVAICAVGVALVRRRSAMWPAAAAVLLLFVSLAAAAELVRAGRPAVARLVVAPVLLRVSLAAVAAPEEATFGEPAAAGQPPAAAGAKAGAPVGQPSEQESGPAPAATSQVAVASAGQPISNRAVEVRVVGVRTTASAGGRTAGEGREFVLVETSWKNVIPLTKVNRKKAGDRTAGAGSLGFGGGATARDRADEEANTTLEPTRFEIGPMPNHVWLVADGPRAEVLDVEATNATPGHLPTDTLSIPALNDVKTGSLVYEAPAGSQSLALLVLDAAHGHLLIPIRGTAPRPMGGLGGARGSNSIVDLAVTGVNWSDGPADRPGTRTLVVGLRGISRREALADVPFGEFGFLQTDQGCMARPEDHSETVLRSLSPVGRFPPFAPGEGQLAFVVPADSKGATLLLRVRQPGGSMDLPVLSNARPSWPAAVSTVTDGNVLKVHRLPGTAVPAGVPPAPSGSERIALDLVVENLRTGEGIELQLGQQFRVVTPDGKRIEPEGDSDRAPCSLTGDVVPAASSRRFTLVYDVPPGQPLQLEYRGFNVKSELVTVR